MTRLKKAKLYLGLGSLSVCAVVGTAALQNFLLAGRVFY